jgi:hypothetical protein
MPTTRKAKPIVSKRSPCLNRERPARIQRIVEHDLDRNALHHLDVVSRGILRRQQAEGRAAAALEAVDMAVEGLVGIGVYADFDRLADAHLGKLRFLEIGGDPDVERHQRRQRLSDLHVVTRRDVLVRDGAGLGGEDLRVGEVEPRLLHLRLCAVQCGFSGLDPAFRHHELRFG